MFDNRKMPESPAAEAAVIASMLLNANCIPDVIDILRSSDAFYRPEHRMMFEGILELYERSLRPATPYRIDIKELCRELELQGLLEKAGGEEYIRKIMKMGKRKQFIQQTISRMLKYKGMEVG